MDKEELKRLCHIVAGPLNGDRLDDVVEKILQSGCVNLEDADEKILPSAIMAALFEDMMKCCLNGSLNDSRVKAIKKEYKNIKNFVPVSY